MDNSLPEILVSSQKAWSSLRPKTSLNLMSPVSVKASKQGADGAKKSVARKIAVKMLATADKVMAQAAQQLEMEVVWFGE